MKWGRRKKVSFDSSSSSNSYSLISHVFPVSWLSKFKHKSNEMQVEVKAGNVKRNSAKCDGGEGDDYWRLSFEGVEGKKKSDKGGVRSVWYGSDDDDEIEVPSSCCRKCGANVTMIMREEEIQKFNDLVLDARKKMRELPAADCQQDAVNKTQRVITVKEKKMKNMNQRVSKEKSRKSDEKDNFEFEVSRKSTITERANCKLMGADLKKDRHVFSTNSRNSNLRTIEEDDVFAAQSLNETYGISAEKMSSEWENLKLMKIRELKAKIENQRKSIYISRELQRRTKQNSKVRVNSPRIKAIEDMKKAKLKMRKGKEKTVEGITDLESFAVVKCSFDPQNDFRDSMLEMIMEKRISQPEQLEELLACYLELNSDEYHDLIIKVFRQVWFELNQAYVDDDEL